MSYISSDSDSKFCLTTLSKYESMTKEAEKQYLVFDGLLSKVCEEHNDSEVKILSYRHLTFLEEDGSLNKKVRMVYGESTKDLWFDYKKTTSSGQMVYKVFRKLIDANGETIPDVCTETCTYTIVRDSIKVTSNAYVNVVGSSFESQTMRTPYVITSPYKLYLGSSSYDGHYVFGKTTNVKKGSNYETRIDFKMDNFDYDYTCIFKPVFTFYDQETNKKLFDAMIVIEFITSYAPVGD